MGTCTSPVCSQDEGFQILRSRRAAGKIVFKLSPDADVVPVSAVGPADAAPESAAEPAGTE